MNLVMRIVKEEELQILQQNFDINCSLTFEVRKANLNMVLGKLEKVEGVEMKYLATM